MSEENSKKQLDYIFIDVLWAPLIFYVLTQWDKQDSWQEHFGLVIIFILVLNEYYSIKLSYLTQKTKFYILDMVSFALFFSAIEILSNESIYEIGYNPFFWVLISFIWLGYSIWDFMMCSHASDDYKKMLRIWGFKMIGFFCVGIICSGFLYYLLENSTLPGRESFLAICQIVPVVLVVLSTVDWIMDFLFKNN